MLSYRRHLQYSQDTLREVLRIMENLELHHADEDSEAARAYAMVSGLVSIIENRKAHNDNTRTKASQRARQSSLIPTTED